VPDEKVPLLSGEGGGGELFKRKGIRDLEIRMNLEQEKRRKMHFRGREKREPL